MRLPSWAALVGSIAMLLALGGVGWQANRDALRAAESVHRRDTAALTVHNSTMIASYLQLSAKELLDFSTSHPFSLRPDDPADRKILGELASASSIFRHAVALVDLRGEPINASPGAVLPAGTDPAFLPMRQGLLAGGAGYSSVITVGGTLVTATAIPLVVDGVPRAVLVGFSRLADSQLQRYLTELNGTLPADVVQGIVDSTGRVTAASDAALLGSSVSPSLIARLGQRGTPPPVTFRQDGREMLGFLATGSQGGWAYFRTQPHASFYGPIRSRNTRTTLALLGLILGAGVTLTVANHRSEAIRRRGEQRFAAIVRNGADLILVMDGDGKVSYESPSVSRVLRHPPGYWVGRPGFSALHPDDRVEFGDLLTDLLPRPGVTVALQCRVQRADGAYRWVDVNACNLLHNPAVRGVVFNARDVSDSRELQDRLARQAMYDSLTELPNRRLFQDKLRSSLGEATRPVAVLFVDLDRFKAVNDAYGHDAGDELLRQTGRRLSDCVRDRDVVARIGGDEFVVLMDDLDSREEATRAATRIVEAISEPFDLVGQTVHIGASVGISLSDSGADPDEVLRSADAAMYNAKRSGGLRYVHHAT